MALDDDIRILSGVGLFAELTQEQLRLLAFGAETMRFAAGREIYRENATADCAYVIARGEVVLYRDHDGEAMLLARLGEGAILGELALIAQARRLSYAAAATDTGHAGNTAAFAVGHPEKVIDLGYRAVHEMAARAKQLIDRFYGAPPALSIWNGCSQGGRQGIASGALAAVASARA